MSRFFPYLIICAVVFFTGCSASDMAPVQNEVKVEQSEPVKSDSPSLGASSENDVEADDEEDEGFDEFEEEFAGEETYDPLEGYNRTMTRFNDSLYVYVLEPVASGYRSVVPRGGRKAIDRFIENIYYPVRLSSSILQAKFECAGTETLRFLINTTIGLLGFFDPAKSWFGITECDEDIGQAMGYWGVGAGPHIVLPFFGPSNLRDTFARYPKSYVDPIGQIRPYTHYAAALGVEAVNYTSLHSGEYESLKRDAVDFYILIRDAYEQLRKKKIEE